MHACVARIFKNAFTCLSRSASKAGGSGPPSGTCAHPQTLIAAETIHYRLEMKCALARRQLSDIAPVQKQGKSNEMDMKVQMQHLYRQFHQQHLQTRSKIGSARQCTVTFEVLV